MKSCLRFLPIAVLLLGCTQQEDVVAQAVAAPAPATVRGSLSPAAPVQLDYRIAQSVVSNQQNTVAIEITTRLDRGSLLVEVAKQQGVALLCDTQRSFDLGNTARPIKFELPLLPADQAERFLILLLTVDTPMGPMSRSFRIDLSTPVDVEQPAPIPQ